MTIPDGSIPDLLLNVDGSAPESHSENSDLHFTESGTPHPVVQSAMSDSTVNSLDEMRTTDRNAHETARRQLIINGHNDMIKDLLVDKRLTAVRLEDDGRTLVVEAQANNYVRKTAWSLAIAKELIPGNWYEDMPLKVIGILDDLDVSRPKPQAIAHQLAIQAQKEAERRATLSIEERAGALRQYNEFLEKRFRTRKIVKLYVTNGGKTIVLMASTYLDQVQKIEWTIGSDGRLF